MTEVVCAIIINSQGRVFAARRAEGKSFEGYWEFPGGKLEEAEQPEEALKRELKEELGLSIQVGPSLHAVEWENKIGKFRLEAFICRDELRGLQLADHDAADWFGVEDLLELEMMIADLALLPYLDAYLQKRFS